MGKRTLIVGFILMLLFTVACDQLPPAGSNVVTVDPTPEVIEQDPVDEAAGAEESGDQAEGASSDSDLANENENEGEDSATAQPEEETQAEENDAASDTDVETVESEDEILCPAGEVSFTHQMLATESLCIPAGAERIVALDSYAAETLIALGITPAGLSDKLALQIHYPELSATLDGIIDVERPPNLEVVQEANPDLIIGSFEAHSELYDSLTAVAPTILFEIDQTAQWKDLTRATAIAVGQGEEIEPILDAYAQRVDTLAETLDGESPTVSIARIFPREFSLYQRDSFPGTILQDIGLSRPASQDYTADEAFEAFGNATFNTVSSDAFDQADGDYLILWAFGLNAAIIEEARERATSLIDDPQWESLRAVESGTIFFGGSYYISGGIYAANKIVDDLYMILADEDALLAAPNPLLPENTAVAIDALTICEPGQRLFDHELLETDPVCIPDSAERIVTLAPAPFDLMLALGEETPVGAIGYLESIYERNFPYTTEQAAEVTFVGFPANLEEIVALEPDLIIQSPFGQEELEQLEAIAATVVLPSLPNVQWEDSMRFTAELLNKVDEVETLLLQYDARVNTLRRLVGNPTEIEISVVRYYDDSGATGLQMQLANAFSTDILTDVGFARPESQAYSAEEATELYGSPVAATLSLEELPLIDGQYLFAWSQAPDAEGDAANETAWSQLGEDPLWSTLEAVQNENTFQVGGHWVGWGFAAAHELLDDLYLHVAGVDPASAAPNPFLPAAAVVDESLNAEAAAEGISPLPRTVKNYRGNDVTIVDDSVIVAVHGPLTEIVFALGMGDRVVGTDISSTYPPEVTSLPQVGYVRNLSAEPILALEPTLILATESVNPPQVVDQLEASGVTVVQFAAPDTVEASIQLIRDVSAALGVEERGEALISKMETDLDNAATLLEQVNTTPRVMLIYARGIETVAVAGTGTSVDVVFELAGMSNAVTQWEGYQPLTAEGAITLAPDAFLMFESGLRSIGGPEGLMRVPGLSDTPAGINRNIHSMDGLLLTGLGPRIGEAVIELIEIFHPELNTDLLPAAEPEPEPVPGVAPTSDPNAEPELD